MCCHGFSQGWKSLYNTVVYMIILNYLVILSRRRSTTVSFFFRNLPPLLFSDTCLREWDSSSLLFSSQTFRRLRGLTKTELRRCKFTFVRFPLIRAVSTKELLVIGCSCLRKDFWVRQGSNVAIFRRKIIGEGCIDVQRN